MSPEGKVTSIQGMHSDCDTLLSTRAGDTECPDNKDKYTKNNFLSILFAEIWDIENSWRPF